MSQRARLIRLLVVSLSVTVLGIVLGLVEPAMQTVGVVFSLLGGISSAAVVFALSKIT